MIEPVGPEVTTLLIEALDTIRDGIVVMDHDARIVWVNKWISSNFPEHAPFIGRSFADTFASSTVSSFDRPCGEAIATGQPQSFDAMLPDPRGGQRWLEVQIWRLEGSGGDSGGAVARFNDVTERRRMERQQRLSRHSVDHVNAQTLWLDRDGRIQEVSEPTCRWLGYTEEEMLQMTIADVDPTAPSRWEDDWRALAEQGEISFETVHYAKDGTGIPVEVNASYVNFEGEEYSFVLARDITERREMQRRLENEMAWRRMLVRQSRDGIVVLDRDGGVVEASESYARQLGYTLDEARALKIWEWDSSIPKAELLRMLSQVDPSGDHFETRHRCKDGSVIDVEISTNGAEIGGEKYIFCVCRDVTERKRVEAEREGLIRELKEALAEIRTLRGILPVCSYCHKVRDDEGYWHQVDVYIRDHSEADVSHGVCPECLKKHYGDLGE
jgi:PAS domain S-box-containing protein